MNGHCGCGKDMGGKQHQNKCGCGRQADFRRRFATKEEQIKELGSYLDALNTEAKAVKEKIEELKK